MDVSVLVALVEDDPAIQEVLVAALEDAGYAVTSASSGEQAITILEAQIAECRALITDIQLAGKLTGWDVAQRARELNAELPVIYMTGNSGDEWSSRGVPNSVLVTKPFAPAQIVTAVSQALIAKG